MLTQIDLDHTLFAEAFRHVKVTTPTELLHLALRALIVQHPARISETDDGISQLSSATQPDLDSLAEVIAQIQQLPKPVANCQPASGLLAEHLRDSAVISDPSFDVTSWNQTWEVIEAQMNSLELAEQQAEGRAG